MKIACASRMVTMATVPLAQYVLVQHRLRHYFKHENRNLEDKNKNKGTGPINLRTRHSSVCVVVHPLLVENEWGVHTVKTNP